MVGSQNALLRINCFLEQCVGLGITTLIDENRCDWQALLRRSYATAAGDPGPKRNRDFSYAIPMTMRAHLTLIALIAIWPFSGKDYHMIADPSVPAAAGTVHAERDKDNRNTKLEIKVEHLARPASLNPPASTYLVWVRPTDRDATKEGAIGVDKDLKGEVHVVTVSKDFDVFITPEQSESVTVPSSTQVLRAHVNMD